jgi:hypothetical protein
VTLAAKCDFSYRILIGTFTRGRCCASSSLADACPLALFFQRRGLNSPYLNEAHMARKCDLSSYLPSSQQAKRGGGLLAASARPWQGQPSSLSRSSESIGQLWSVIRGGQWSRSHWRSIIPSTYQGWSSLPAIIIRWPGPMSSCSLPPRSLFSAMLFATRSRR